eukprot:5281655-Prorocentrum_lima.AAC.1
MCANTICKAQPTQPPTTTQDDREPTNTAATTTTTQEMGEDQTQHAGRYKRPRTQPNTIWQ